jgi:hypothetical protein
VARLLVLALVLPAASFAAPSARAEWRRSTDIELNTAFTLEEGTLSIGLLSPLTVGVTDSFQAAIHPVLLLLGQPSMALRLRLTPVDDIAAALNVAGAWSFIRRETSDGRTTGEADGDPVGFPGTLQITETTTFRVGERVLLSAGAGVAGDFLGLEPVRGLIETHLSLHWLAAARHLLMLQLMGYLPFTEKARLLRPSAQLLYAWSIGSTVQLALGVGVGEWVWESSDAERTTVRVFPLVDVWFRF